MKYHLFLWIFIILIKLHTYSSVSGPHIADVNILLPPKMTNPVEYRLLGSDGCFQWSWDHHDILSVVPEYNSSNQCSMSARLKSIAPYSGRKETAVYASDVQTGIIVRCKVFIDNLSRIQIFHNSIKLDLDGLATLHVRAFDSEDNIFSSLVGLQFIWKLMPETDKSSHHLVNVPLKDSPLSDRSGLYGDLSVQIKIEESGVFSDLYVVKGVRIGHEIVSMHLMEPHFEHIKDKIVLTVAEAISLIPPSPVFVLCGSQVQFGLKVIRGNISQAVSLPSPYYRWSVFNSSVAQVDSTKGIAHTLNLGITDVTVEDTRVVGHIQMLSLHVIVPGNLFLYILPLSLFGYLGEELGVISSATQWYIISGKQYVISMKVFSPEPDSREIYITENDDVKLQYTSDYWKTSLVTDSLVARHGWQDSRILNATSYGLGKLIASLSYSTGHLETKKVLKVVQEVMVCDQVKLVMRNRADIFQSILLPWAPTIYQEVELKAIGGCAKATTDYTWVSLDTSIVSVSATGIIRAKTPGNATVKVISIFDSDNFDEVLIEVSIPSTMVMLQNFPVEAVVGSELQAVVTMKTLNGAYYYKCDAFNSFVRWKVASESFILTNTTWEISHLDNIETVDSDTSVLGSPCAWINLYASLSGRALLHATLSKEYQQYEPIILKTSSRIVAYAPLQVRQVSDGNQFGGYGFDLTQEETSRDFENLSNLYLVPGCQLDVMLLGGPERWDQAIEYVESTEILVDENADPKNVNIFHAVSTSSGSSYRIFCQTVGIYKLVFKRGNLIGDDHPVPTVAEAELSLSCSFPSSIILIVNEPANVPGIIWSAIQANRDPENIRVAPVKVANVGTIRIAAASITKFGDVFANSSALHLNWELSNCNGLADWDSAYNFERSQSSWERFLALQNESGLCTVRATVVNFSDINGHNLDPSVKRSVDILTDAIRLQLVSTLRIVPEFNLVLFNPNVKINLSIAGGSCFLNSVVNDSSVVEIIHPPLELQCSQLIIAPKELGFAILTVYDIGLVPPVAATSLVEVADVNWIKILSEGELSIMEGDLQSINLLAGVSNGQTFDSSQYVYMNLFVHIKDHIIGLFDDDVSSAGGGFVNAPNFVIFAKNIGVTTLYVSAKQQSGHEVFSHLITVEVYVPPQLHPDNIILAPGASYVLTMKGGPTFGGYVEYACKNDGTASVHKSSGRLSAISPGNTTLVAKIYGNGDILLCEVFASVKIAVPSSVMLSVQSKQLGIGREMPIYPSLIEGDLFSFYEVCKDYKWTLKDEKVLGFKISEHLHGSSDASFINVLYGRSTGRTDVVVSFSCDFISDGSFSESRSYNASASLLVVPDLPLALGVPITWILPPYYTSSSLLPSSFKLTGQLDSLSHKGVIMYSLLRDCGGKNEACKAGIKIDGDRIKTLESNNLACIQAKDQNSGKIEIAACVRVSEVAQIGVTSMEFPLRSIVLPLGSELELPITYFDVLGNPFLEAYNVIQLDVETNYPDIVYINNTRAGNGNIHIKAARHGRAVLRISIHGSFEKFDYIMISVGAHLYPQNPILYLGNSLNCSIEGINDKVSGRWLSANESVVYVDAQSGKASAVGEGVTRVIFEGSNLALQTTVTVLKENIIFVDAPKEALTNILFPLKGYNFSVKFSNPYGIKIKNLENIEDVLHDCKVDPPCIGYAKPWRDLDTGNSYCLFYPYPPEHLVQSMPKLKNTKPNIYVSLYASLIEDNRISGFASALFIGGFTILENDKLNFTSEYNISVITILGNTDVEIDWQHRNLLSISSIHRDDLGIGGRAQFEVKVLKAKKFIDKIIIMLPATGQKVEVEINYEPDENHPSDYGVNITIWLVILFSIVMLLITVAVAVYLLDRPEKSQPHMSRSTPNFPAFVSSHNHSSPSTFNEHSPRTPSPFVEFVRRTIDETPNYRRDGRRRFNPQHTL